MGLHDDQIQFEEYGELQVAQQTIADLRTELDQSQRRERLLEMSQSSLMRKLEKVTKVSRSRLKRMNQRGKLLIEARATIARLSREAHGG